MQVKLSVLMPAFNAEKYIGEAIESVLTQTFVDFELIIVNDGSTDRTKEIILSYKDNRIRLINTTNQGIAAALNKGLAIAKAKYIVRFDADDICYPERLEKQYNLIKIDPEIMLVGSAADYVDEEGRFIFKGLPPAFKHEEILKILTTTCPFIHSSVLYNKEFIIENGGYNSHAHSFEDHLLWTQVVPKAKSANVDESLIKVRLNKQSITIDEKWRTKQFRRIKKNALRTSRISATEGAVIKNIIKNQEATGIKEGAYYAMIGKKYLWNNFQPERARSHIKKALAFNPFYTTGYGLYLVSFLPGKMISGIYKKFKAIA